MVLLVLVGGVYKPPNVEKFDLEDVPRDLEWYLKRWRRDLEFKVPLRCQSRYHVALPFKVPEDKIQDQSLEGLSTPPTKTSNTTPHYYPKYEI